MRFFSFFILLVGLSFFSCEKEADPDDTYINLSGEFVLKSGTCQSHSRISISGETLTWRGIEFSGSTDIIYVEVYERSSDDPNKYLMVGAPTSFVTVIDEDNYTFTSSVRSCEYGRETV